VYAASLKLDVYDTWGNLSVHGAAGFMNINKSAWGNMTTIDSNTSATKAIETQKYF
jgi:hypothetical protein